jgi:hypothetical protein
MRRIFAYIAMTKDEAQRRRWAFCKAFGFFRQGMYPIIIAPTCGNAPPVNNPDYQ